MESVSSTNTINMSFIDEKRSNTTTVEAINVIIATTNETDDQYKNDSFHYRTLKTKTGNFMDDFPIRNFYKDGGERNSMGSVFEKETDREQEDEIFYDSTNENEDYEIENASKSENKAETINKYERDNYDLSKLYLQENEIEVQDEQQTLNELMDIGGKDKRIKQNKNRHLSLAVLLRLIFPLTNGVIQSIKGMKDLRLLKILRSIASSRMILTDLFAYAANTISLNLSSVQVTHRIEPILNLLKIRLSRDGVESLPDTPTKPHAAETLTTPTFSPLHCQPRYSLPNFQVNSKKLSIREYEATKCCTLNILAEPPTGQAIRADIVFIHGLNGSLANTWKQGLWENERRPVEFQRPPKPPLRPPKRPRHSRTSTVHPSHHKKMARFAHADVCQKFSHERDSVDEANENAYSVICGDTKDLQICDGIEYGFPTFRLRTHDNGRLLQAECDDSHQYTNNTQNETELPENTINSNGDEYLSKKQTKPSVNDPNYSKCWPGDWLPIDCPGVRVMALNYTTDQHLWRPIWKKKEARSNLIQRSKEMIELLIKHRVGYGQPIIWVGHSKGGLFIKQIIVDAWESGRPAVAPLWRSARGVFFYSVPHRGSHLASVKAPFLLRSVELIDIEKNNKYLLDLHRRFAGLYILGHLKIEVFSFVETALTLMSVLYLRIVGVDSGDPGIGDVCGIRLDHREICKPRSRDCILYRQLVNMINKVS